jgi:5-methylcytosine-specific restriction protein A
MKAGKSARLRQSERTLTETRAIVWERAGGICEFCGDKRADEVHHRRNRAMGGSSDPDIHAVSSLLALCRDCHRAVGDFPRGAEALGLLVPHGEAEPRDVPVQYRGRRVLLNDDGGIRPVAAA